MDLQVEIKENDTQNFQYKRLERIRVFFCHLDMVFEICFPYLTGFHLTFAKHLPKKDDESWKLSDLQWTGYVEDRVETRVYNIGGKFNDRCNEPTGKILTRHICKASTSIL